MGVDRDGRKAEGEKWVKEILLGFFLLAVEEEER